MCGIVGIYHRNRKCSEERLLAMRDLQSHRGPDDQGVYLDGNIGLGHRRLSIIDLGSGHQPMLTADGDLCVVFNGEIYNYKALRRELEGRGCVFRTNSDTEVLLHLYREYGEKGVQRLNGIFAFAIWDKTARQLFLARDHMGIKPLYYFRSEHAFVFASEAKSIFASGEVTARCDSSAVPEYLAFRHVAGGKTLFKDIQTLQPGHCMTIAGGVISIRPYWSPIGITPAPQRSLEESVDHLDELLTDAVSMQLMSDVPLGTFCSGGVDSSLVTALCARAAGRQIDTYSVGFYETAYDETEYARLVSKQYATQHHELRLSNAEFTERLPKSVWHNDEPINFPNSVLIHALSEMAKKRVTVVLTGEGADELFAGYPRYLLPTFVARIQKLPHWVQRTLRAALGVFRDHRMHKLANQMREEMSDVLLFNSASLGHEQQSVLRHSLGAPMVDNRMGILRGAAGNFGWLRRIALLEQSTYLLSILNRQDKMSMAAGVESRVPILDYRVVEFANTLPDNYCQRLGHTKYILKKVAERYLPAKLVHRKKSGFGVPLDDWFRSDTGLGFLAQSVFNDDNLPETDRFMNAKTLLLDHKTGKGNHGELLWTLLCFALWKKQFGIA
jgi:asparagine synthase (glutamine-hydrolysing)